MGTVPSQRATTLVEISNARIASGGVEAILGVLVCRRLEVSELAGKSAPKAGCGITA